MRRRSTDYLVLHCSATPPSADIGAPEIRQWHKAKGWADIGYHFVIRRDGMVEEGRPADEIGSHVKGSNANALGICLVGGIDSRQKPKNNFAAAQWAALSSSWPSFKHAIHAAGSLGIVIFPMSPKACPCFDAIAWARANGFRAAVPLRSFTASMLRAIRQETEDGDEVDDIAAASTTGPGKWLTAILGSGGAGSLAAFGYGMDWLSLLVFMLGLASVTCGVLLAIGYERRERLWDRLFG